VEVEEVQEIMAEVVVQEDIEIHFQQNHQVVEEVQKQVYFLV
jgi:hypothetical protein